MTETDTTRAAPLARRDIAAADADRWKVEVDRFPSPTARQCLEQTVTLIDRLDRLLARHSK